MVGLELPKRVFPCASPADVRATLPEGKDVLAFQCRNPIHKAHYELFIRALDAPNAGEGAVCLVHPTCGPTQVRALLLRPHGWPGLQKPPALSPGSHFYLRGCLWWFTLLRIATCNRMGPL